MSKILSIIIPTYNAEKFLNKGLSSFLVCRDTDAQTAQHNCKMATEGRFEEIDIDKAILDKLEVIVVMTAHLTKVLKWRRNLWTGIRIPLS